MTELLSSLLVLAQDGAAGLPDAAGSSTPAAGQRPSGGLDPFFIIMFAFVAFMLIVAMLGPRREKKRREALLQSLRKHDRVQTIGGIIGSIVELRDDTIVLKVDESSNTRLTFARSAIQQVIGSREARDSRDARDAAPAPVPAGAGDER